LFGSNDLMTFNDGRVPNGISMSVGALVSYGTDPAQVSGRRLYRPSLEGCEAGQPTSCPPTRFERSACSGMFVVNSKTVKDLASKFRSLALRDQFTHVRFP